MGKHAQYLRRGSNVRFGILPRPASGGFTVATGAAAGEIAVTRLAGIVAPAITVETIVADSTGAVVQDYDAGAGLNWTISGLTPGASYSVYFAWLNSTGQRISPLSTAFVATAHA